MDHPVKNRAFPFRARRYRCELACWPLKLFLAACLAMLAPYAAAAAPESLEYKVKAAFLLNFTRFIDWPPQAFPAADAPLPICILGDDPFGGALDQIAGGESVNGHGVTIQRLDHGPVPNTCRVLFIAGHDNDLPIPPDLAPGVLTVGEREGFLKEGGMIAFVIENRRVRFDVSQTAANTAGFKVSSRLLSVARAVEK